jgi:DNA mismatch endonuclease (patch repair protein)
MRASASYSYAGLKPASSRASEAARSASKKANTKCELLLRKSLWQLGCRFRINVRDLPGRPDIVFARVRVVVFCDGDFWHGRNWTERRRRLRAGHNPDYWTKKIARNIERDRECTSALVAGGWTVLRFWESDIVRRLDAVAASVVAVLDERGHRRQRRLLVADRY